jgi:hypothetical protein
MNELEQLRLRVEKLEQLLVDLIVASHDNPMSLRVPGFVGDLTCPSYNQLNRLYIQAGKITGDIE